MNKLKNLGTKEWATSNINIFSGCEHDCKYCYAKRMAIRFNRKTEDNWKIMEINQKTYSHSYRHRRGIIMFPTAHDITPATYPQYKKVLKKLIDAKNKILIVSKPHLDCIMNICQDFDNYKRQIEFRFTIGTNNNQVLKFWEINAPNFEERYDCVKYAQKHEFRVSISIEPLLIRDPSELINLLSPYVKEIWIGKMNNYCLTKPKYFEKNELEMYGEQQYINSDYNFQSLKIKFANNPLIRFKNINKIVY